MRITRDCSQGLLNTGVSGCPVDFKHIKGAILVTKGTKLSKDLTATELTELCHADRPDRVMPVKGFVEYAKEGGEPQVSANGYGASTFTGMSPQTDTFTLGKFYPELHAQILKAVNTEFGVYYYTKDNRLIGLNDELSDELFPIPVNLVPSATPFKTSSAQSIQTVGFSYVDTEYVHKHYDYVKLEFDIDEALIGLVLVELQKRDDNDWRLVEKVGGLDRTAEFGNLLKDAGATAIPAASSVTYMNGVLGITLAQGKTEADVVLAKASVLYNADIEGIQQWDEE